jgi:hydrogenase maturation factor HypE
VIVDELHGLSPLQDIQGADDGGVAKAFGHPAGIKGIGGVGAQV